MTLTKFSHYYITFFHFNPAGFIFVHFFLILFFGALLENKLHHWVTKKK